MRKLTLVILLFTGCGGFEGLPITYDEPAPALPSAPDVVPLACAQLDEPCAQTVGGSIDGHAWIGCCGELLCVGRTNQHFGRCVYPQPE